MSEEKLTPKETQMPQMLPTNESPTIQMLKALRDMSSTGRVDPISTLSYIMLIREMRRMEREDMPQPTQSTQIDIEKLVEKMNESWEKRFMEYQHRIETLILGKKAEEAEKKAEELEKKLKEIEERKRTEEEIQKRVESALTPLQERIKEIQSIILNKTASMSENERKSFFQTLGEEIEKAISSEITETIAKNIRNSLIKAFTKEEETPITPEGKVNWAKILDKWIVKALDTMKAVAEKMPVRPPQPRPVQQIPIQPTPVPSETPPSEQKAATSTELVKIATTATQPVPAQFAELVPQTETPPTSQEPTTVKSEKPPSITEETKVEPAERKAGSETTGEGVESKGS
ncbi:MAG: hypothetical protein QXX41_05770 [Nitrososphaerota archaeon]